MAQFAKLILITLSILSISFPAYCEEEEDEDIPEETLCDNASLKGAVIAYIDHLYSGEDGEGDEGDEEESFQSDEDNDEDLDSPSYDQLKSALMAMSRGRIFFSKNPGVILGSLSKSSVQDLKGLDRIDFSDEEELNDEDLIDALYNGENCADLEKILSGYKASKLKRFNSKKQLADLVKSAGMLSDLIDGLSEADLIDSETSIELTEKVNRAIAAANAAKKKARR